MTDWQPIETAPRDGTRILLYDKTHDFAISGRWHIDAGRDDPGGHEPAWAWWVSDDGLAMWDNGPDDQPTHWAAFDPPK